MTIPTARIVRRRPPRRVEAPGEAAVLTDGTVRVALPSDPDGFLVTLHDLGRFPAETRELAVMDGERLRCIITVIPHYLEEA